MALITINGAATNVTATGEDVVTVVQNATNLNSLHDVSTNGINNGDILVYNSTSSNWENGKTLTGDYLIDGSIGSNNAEIDVNVDLNLQDNVLLNVNRIDVVTAKIKKISPEQFSQASTPRTKFFSDWSNAAHQAAIGADITGEFLMGAGDLSAFSQGLPFSAMDITTPNGHSVFFVGAAGGDFTDGESDDNATHDCKMYMRGESNVIASVSEATLGTKKPLTIDSSDFTVNSTDKITLNGELVNYSNNKANFVVQPSYSTVSGDAVDYIRRNAEDGTNDSDILDGSEVKFNLYIQSADESSSQLIGGMTGSTHSTDGNQLLFTLDNQAQTSQANSFTLTEEKVQIQQPLQFPSFSSTDRDAMSPIEGWVLFNSTTSKLQVYDGTSWVDLH